MAKREWDDSGLWARKAEGVEDRACRAALKAHGLNPSYALRAAGLRSGGLIKFHVLASSLDFPVCPAVTAEPPGPLQTVLAKFRSSRLWEAWAAAWDARPEPPDRRVLVFTDISWGLCAAYDSTEAPPRPHVLVGHDVGARIAIEPFTPWCRALPWYPPAGAGGRPDDGD